MSNGLITLGDVLDVESFDLMEELNQMRREVVDPIDFDLDRFNEIMDQLWGTE